MREIVLDTETTGLDPKAGHKLVEIGCLELINHIPTGEKLHIYINPEREMDPGAFEIHGLSTEFLAQYKPFREHADEILEFLGDAKLIIHNASFDMKFLNFELGACNRPLLPMSQALDTVRLARQKYPGAQVSLDALCRRFEIKNDHRTLHGALLDSELLAEVYLELIGGRQPGLEMGGPGGSGQTSQNAAEEAAVAGSRAQGVRPPRPHAATPEELAAHGAFIATLKEPIWET
jgi:DNA polymerase-3 subunit epsilon